MSQMGKTISGNGVELRTRSHINLTPPALYEEAIRRGEGRIAAEGPLVAMTAPHTGRSPGDKFIVREPSSEREIWWGKVNQPFDLARYEALRDRFYVYLENRDVFVQDVFVGADPRYSVSTRVITQYAWHSLFARHLFRHTYAEGQDHQEPAFTVICAPEFKADPARDGTASETFILVNLADRLILIGGSKYPGEIKKSMFGIMNYLLPRRGVMPMHCSANYGPSGDVALFFGLSGTGKTTLSADSTRTLIGDDEHGWSDHGVFNFEGGCYAKIIHLSAEAEPEIYATTRRFGTVIENVVMDQQTRTLDLEDASITENTRAAYPIDYIPNATPTGQGGHPKNILFLTADAFGVLPPISKLTINQARYHFLSGYTAKVAGTERGLTGVQPSFSTCFAAPFLPLPPGVYSGLLGEKIQKHGAQVWLVNTGWSGGPFGVGRRMKIAYTRALVHAALNGLLDDVPTQVQDIFRVEIPTACPGVPSEVLDPKNTWADPAAYDTQANALAHMFAANFAQFQDLVPVEVREAGPLSD